MILRRVLLVPCIALVLAGVAACQPGSPPDSPPLTDLPVAAPTAPESVPDSDAPPAELEGMAEPELTPETEPPEAAAAEPTATVDVSPNLRATDPSTVRLAVGHPQLVEFFAFW